MWMCILTIKKYSIYVYLKWVESRLLESLKEYDMSVLYHPRKANVVADALSCKTMESVSLMEDGKKCLVKDVHRLSWLGVRLEDSSNGGFLVDQKSKSSLLVEVRSKQHLDPLLMELQKFVLSKLNDLFSRGDGVLRYQGWLCVPDVDNLSSKILEEDHWSLYSIHPSTTKLYRDLSMVIPQRGTASMISKLRDLCRVMMPVSYGSLSFLFMGSF